uniref:Uncharacterized protein n=1 Tax=Triticum urartu TaxID=4572 RepID=A0A8R7Q1H5_TRIUA
FFVLRERRQRERKGSSRRFFHRPIPRRSQPHTLGLVLEGVPPAASHGSQHRPCPADEI